MLIVTNIRSFPRQWTATSGLQGETAEARTVGEFLAHRRNPEAVWVVNCDVRLTLLLAAALTLRPFGPNPPLIAVDLVLRRPGSTAARLTLGIKRFLFSRVSLFIHYFRDLRGYDEVFGISAERSSFVPFKSNLQGRYPAQPSPDGEYVLCFGRSLRDYDTFFDAIERLPYPAAIGRPDFAGLKAHGARFTRSLENLPRNVRVLDDRGDDAAQLEILGGAKLVVLPILKTSMVASGISTCLNAMFLGKCVIGSEGPGMSDIFSGEVLTAAPEDASALAAAIRRAWEDDELRRNTAAKGHAYVTAQGGEADLYRRLIESIVHWRRLAGRDERAAARTRTA